MGTGRTWRAYFEDFCLCHAWEGRAVSHVAPLPVKACLLLRVGEASLAEKIWDRWTGWVHGSWNGEDAVNEKEGLEVNEPYLQNPYLVLTNCWTLSLFDQAVAAHRRGNDRLALAVVETLARVWPAAVAEATNRGLVRPSADKLRHWRPYYFLLDADRATELLTDQRRRAQRRRQGIGPSVLVKDYPDPDKFKHALLRRLADCPDAASRIEFLIRHLEEEHAEESAPLLAAALCSQGDDAVEPLLVCLDSDNRLTRSVLRDDPYPVAVYPIAEAALEQILKMPFHCEPEPGEPEVNPSQIRRADAAKIRAYWTRYKGVPTVERSYRILADDQAEPRHWLAAATTIVQPASIPLSLETVTKGWDDLAWLVKDKGKLHGDTLRNKTSSSVAELMSRRVQAFMKPYHDLLAKRGKLDERQENLEKRQKLLDAEIEKLDDQLRKLSIPRETFSMPDRLPAEQRKALNERRKELREQWEKLNKQRYEDLQKEEDDLTRQQDELDHPDEVNWSAPMQQGCEMALYLARWEPQAALPLLRRLTAIRRPTTTGLSSDAYFFPERFVAMTLARAAAGDLAGLEEYARWLRKAPPSSLRSSACAPLYRYPDHPAMAHTAQWLFGDRASPWYPVLRPSFSNGSFWEGISGPLMVVPAYRERVLQLLEDRHEMSHVDVTSNAKISIALLGAAGTSTVPNDPLCPPPGTKVAFRVCDACAYALSPLEGTPKCELFWPERERDQAVAACAAMLRRYGHRFRLDERPSDVEGVPLGTSWGWTNSQVHLTFRPFDRPATADDVCKGEAIFSLVGQASVRVSNMPKLPCRARWTTLKDYPVLRDVWKEPGQWEKTIGYEQEGVVWQAEEAEVGGRWQRYYGFVGRYGLAKVPGEEIEFLPSSERAEEWVALDDHFSIGWCAAPSANKERMVRRNEDSEYFPPMLSYRRGQPMVFTVQAWNRSGAEQPLPALGEGPASTAGNGRIPLTFELRYCRQSPMSDFEPTMSGWQPTYSLVGMSWTQVPRKTGERLTVNRMGRKAMPTELIDCLQLDLNRLFDMSRPGTYRLSLKVRSGNRGGWQEDEVIFALGQKPAEPALPGGP